MGETIPFKKLQTKQVELDESRGQIRRSMLWDRLDENARQLLADLQDRIAKSEKTLIDEDQLKKQRNVVRDLSDTEVIRMLSNSKNKQGFESNQPLLMALFEKVTRKI